MAERDVLRGDAPLQASFEKRLDVLIDLADKRYGRTTQDVEALLYLAFGHLFRGEYRFDFDKGMWGAARDGSKAKGYIEAYLKVHPEHADAYLVAGIYNYYVDMAPLYAHVLRFLLFLPAGNRVEGLKQLERAASQGTLFGAYAQRMLVDVYSSLENRPADAVATAERLLQQYPNNDSIASMLAGVYAGPAIEDREKAAAVYQTIIARRLHDETPDGMAARYNAVFNVAGLEFEAWQCREGVATLTAVIEAHPAKPEWAYPNALMRRANYRMLMNDPGAEDDAKWVLADAGLEKWHKNATDLLTAIAARKMSPEGLI